MNHASNLTHLASQPINPISIWIAGVVLHLLAQNPRELVVHGVSLGRMNGAAVSPGESLMNILQKRERNSPAGGFIGRAEDGEAVGSLDVEYVSILGERDVGVSVVRNVEEVEFCFPDFKFLLYKNAI